MRSVLVTGGAGFIGSNFIRHVLCEETIDRLVNLDALTYAGNLENLADCADDSRYCFVHGNICDCELVEKLFVEYAFDTVVNFAAESHVDRSITSPEIAFTTNALGTQTLLEAAKRFWKVDPSNKFSRDYREGVRFLQVSTDEVYGALGSTGTFRETTPLSPNSPYSASKAAADLMVGAYHRTFGFPANITRCSNNYGPYQFPEKLIPLLICNAQNNKPLPVYGDGLQVRDWIHVQDHCRAICTVLKNGQPGEVYIIGGDNGERTNLEIVHLILRELGKPESLIIHIKDRPGHDRRYAIDHTKITRELHWKPQISFEEGIYRTIQWYMENSAWVERIMTGDYQIYCAEMYGSEIV